MQEVRCCTGLAARDDHFVRSVCKRLPATFRGYRAVRAGASACAAHAARGRVPKKRAQIFVSPLTRTSFFVSNTLRSALTFVCMYGFHRCAPPRETHCCVARRRHAAARRRHAAGGPAAAAAARGCPACSPRAPRGGAHEHTHMRRLLLVPCPLSPPALAEMASASSSAAASSSGSAAGSPTMAEALPAVNLSQLDLGAPGSTRNRAVSNAVDLWFDFTRHAFTPSPGDLNFVTAVSRKAMGISQVTSTLVEIHPTTPLLRHAGAQGHHHEPAHAGRDARAAAGAQERRLGARQAHIDVDAAAREARR